MEKNKKIIAVSKFNTALLKNKIELSTHVHDVMINSERTPGAKQILIKEKLLEMFKFTKNISLRLKRTKGRDVLLCEMRDVTLLLAYDALINRGMIVVITILKKGWKVQ